MKPSRPRCHHCGRRTDLPTALGVMNHPCSHCDKNEFGMTRDAVAVPDTGEFYVKDGVVRKVIESEWMDSDDGHDGIMVWVEAKDDTT
ncbi:hypothetical protein ACFY7C_19375 [Streptomyces sp. NPDC012769]|uniref:hypothetical protein n=1 Tax=Streptomyces sp. NPDC012769 TaxID=3364848 RepID=UPI0036CDDB5E